MSNRQQQALRTNRILIKPWTAIAGQLTASAAGTTTAAKTRCSVHVVPATTRAIRLIWGNVATGPVRVGPFAFSASTLFGDYVNPTGGSWNMGSFANGGARNDLPVYLTGQTTYVSAAGNSTPTDPALTSKFRPATDKMPAYTFSDVMPVTLLPRADGGPGALLFIRHLWDVGQTVLRQDYGQGLAVGALNGTQGYASEVAGDHVNTLDAISGAANVFGLPFTAIECFTDAPGINLLVAGDSQLDGTGSTASINAYFNMATSALTREGCPVSSVNLAWGGSRLNQWFAQLVAALDFVQPSALLMQGISWNDDQQSYATMMDSFVWQQARIRAIRAKLDERIPIILVPSMPREAAYNSASNAAELISAWVDARTQLLGMETGNVRIFDLLPLIADMSNPNHWLSGMSDDGMHPNDTGAAVLAAAFTPFLRQVLGL